MSDEPDARIAVYLDFENLVISEYDNVHGVGSWRRDRVGARHGPVGAVKEKVKAARLDVDAVVDYASSIATVTICRAYANWSGPALAQRSVDLVQLFPLSGSKNGADIRLATDVVEDLANLAHLTHVLIAAGDSDYAPVAQKARRSGRQVVGVGVEGSIGRYWQAACDEFKRYDAIVRVEASASSTATPVVPEDPLATPATLLVKALRLAQEARGQDRVPTPELKRVMQRLTPEFDTSALGHRTFSAFLLAHADVVCTDGAKQNVWFVGDDVGPVEDVSPVERVRRAITSISPSTWPLQDTTVAHTVVAVRRLWELLAQQPHDHFPHPEWNARLLADGMATAESSRARVLAVQILGATAVGDGGLEPHADLVDLDDAAMALRLRERIVVRMRLLSPEATPRILAEAVHGPHPTAAELQMCERVVSELDRALVVDHDEEPEADAPESD